MIGMFLVRKRKNHENYTLGNLIYITACDPHGRYSGN
jgi:hypothetical protein